MTAFTFTETLSRVITSWGGTSMVMVRRLTLTILSTKGSRSTSPGPEPSPPGFSTALARRPNRKITPRSYSRRMRTEEPITKMPTIRTRIKPMLISKPPMPVSSRRSAPVGCLDHGEGEVSHPDHLDLLADRHRPVLGDGPPELAVHQHLALGGQRGPHHPDLADHPALAGGGLAVQRPHPVGEAHHHQAGRGRL